MSVKGEEEEPSLEEETSIEETSNVPSPDESKSPPPTAAELAELERVEKAMQEMIDETHAMTGNAHCFVDEYVLTKLIEMKQLL